MGSETSKTRLSKEDDGLQKKKRHSISLRLFDIKTKIDLKMGKKSFDVSEEELRQMKDDYRRASMVGLPFGLVS